MRVEEWKRKNPPIQRKPKTNADRIRAMTDEELADWIVIITTAMRKDRKPWLDWLKQEATE